MAGRRDCLGRPVDVQSEEVLVDQALGLVFGWMAESNMERCQQAVDYGVEYDDALTAGLKQLSVSDSEQAVGGDDDILEVSLDIDNFGGFLRGTGTLMQVRVGSPEVRAMLLGSLPRCSAGKWQSNRAFDDIIHGDVAHDGVFHLGNEFADLTARVKAFPWVSAGEIRR